MITGLAWVARQGRVFLVLGLLAGLTMQPLAQAIRPVLPELIAMLLLVTALRIGPRAAVGSGGDLKRTLKLVALFQVILPGVAALVLWFLGALSTPLGMVIVLALAAPSVTGAPNFTLILGYDPALAMRLLIVGTALFPLTVLPLFALVPELSGGTGGLTAAGSLMAVIFGAAGVGFLLRRLAWKAPRADQLMALEGIAVLLLAIVVVGLMSALGPAILNDPISVFFWCLVAFGLNFGLQISANIVLRGRGWGDGAVPASIVAGNRNIALFLVALPAATTDPLLVFIGCYQLPMYLTPIILQRFYARRLRHGSSS